MKKYSIPSNRTDAKKVKFKDNNFPSNINNVESALNYLNEKISFNDNGELVVTIGDVSKTFVAKPE